jgi:hypothetical protein
MTHNGVGAVTFETRLKPHACVSKDETRPPINAGAQIVCGPDNETALVATDGHTLSIVPCRVSDRGLLGAIIPAEVLDAARRVAKKGKLADATVEVERDSFRLSDGRAFPRPRIEGAFPPCADRVPAPRPEALRVCVDVRLLVRVAEALGDPYVMLTLGESDTDPIRVEVRESTGVAVVMPAKL